MRQPSIHKGAPLPVAAKFCVAVVTAALALAVMSTRLFAGEQSATPPAPTASSSSLMDREILTGGWFDADPLLRNHGVNLAACLTQFYGGLMAGDVRTTGNTAASWTPSNMKASNTTRAGGGFEPLRFVPNGNKQIVLGL